MALTAGRWFTVIELAETSNKRTTKRFEQSAPADYAAALASATALATDIAAVSDAVVTKYYPYQEYVEDALSLPASAELQNQAVLQFSIEDEPTKTGKVVIPAPKASIFAAAEGPNYDVVDVADADVIAFRNNFTSEALYYVSDGEQAEDLLGGKRRHVAHSST